MPHLLVNRIDFKINIFHGLEGSWLKAYIALAEDGVLVLSTHVRWLITTCNLDFKGSDTFFWPPTGACTHVYIRHRQTHVHK